MDLFAPIKDHHSETRLFNARVVLSIVISVLLLGTVVGRLIQLQVFNYEIFAEKSQGNRIRIEPVPPIRGLIFDRRGRVLAENLPTYQLELIPEQVSDIDETLRRLVQMGLIEAEDVDNIKTLARRGPRFKPVTLRFRLDEQEISDFAVQRHRFQGVDFQPRLVRHYPYGQYTAHAIGYVGALSTRDLNRLDVADYSGTFHTGKTGVEFNREKTLHGATGHKQVVTNARGRQIPTDTRDLSQALPDSVMSQPGQSIFLTIDLDLQKIATEAMQGKREKELAQSS